MNKAITIDFLSPEFFESLRKSEAERIAGNSSNFLFVAPEKTAKLMSTDIVQDIISCPLKVIHTNQLISKYIGETEKNLRKILDQAAQHETILFFDDADNLFEKKEEKIEGVLKPVKFFSNKTCSTIIVLNDKNLISDMKNNFDVIVRFPYFTTKIRKLFWKSKLLKREPARERGLKPAAEI